MAETLMAQWLRRLWRERDASVIDELYHPEGVAHGIHGEPLVGAEAFRAFHRSMLAAFPEIDVRVEEELVRGDRVALRLAAEMTPLGATEPIPVLGAGFATIRDGRITEAHNCWDFLGLMEGLGVLPRGALELALSGGLRPPAPD